MNPILQTTADFLKAKQFSYTVAEDGEMLSFGFTGDHLAWTTLASARENPSMLTLVSRVPVRIPAAKRAACSKLLARLNYGRCQGAFHLDLKDGETLFCLSNIIEGNAIPAELMEALIGLTLFAMDNQAPEILKLVFGSRGRGSAASTGCLKPSSGQRLELN